MIKLRKRGKKAPEIMLSPMIDMMFLLLIFFIVSAMYMSELKTIPVKLPVASETITQSTVKFTVTIKDDGAYWLGDKVIGKPELVNRAREEQKKDELLTVEDLLPLSEGDPEEYVFLNGKTVKRKTVQKMIEVKKQGK